MADLTQTTVAVLAQQALSWAANAPMLIGGDIDVRTYLSGVVTICKGKTQATADLTAGLAFIELQASGDAAVDDWYTVRRFVPTGGTANTLAIDATIAAAEVILTTGAVVEATWPAGNRVFITDATNEATNSEWGQIADCDTDADESVTLVDGLKFAKASGDDIYDLADVWSVGMDFSGVCRIRVVAANRGASGGHWVLRADLTAATDIE
jgi:hypothetical protein